MADFEWLPNAYEPISFDAGAQIGEVYAYLNVWSDGEFQINVFSALARQFQLMAEAYGWTFIGKPHEVEYNDQWMLAHFTKAHQEVRDG